jgi:hypothetical protein
MHQGEFDQLARGLATGRLSRRQVLKSFAAGLTLGFVGILSPQRTSVSVAATACSSSAYDTCVKDVEDIVMFTLQECSS